ncbi:Two-component sensor histidine kinase, contains HisKA and HATPase domains [Reichenbachiella faecimaris]|uniref:histidine kinase n=1 Tax=Reichenbachiella faecimaris TaxID=692418 RepID=A0A1W2G670_REIFA|nr:histidine kinase dimerization/phosphoacceptor domain -containing protein [Reichenbachiella faecimaris]SMD31858.1 Two-component sensor histidine kinase, contains HisKA and HATPase domains [Reichenbachiella faecimaris]
MSQFIKRILLLYLTLFFIPKGLFSQPSTTVVKGANPPMVKYDADDFEGNAQIWDVIQNDQGLIYAASFGGIMEFDGEVWKVIDPSLIQSFEPDSSGRIYAAGYASMGYLEQAKDGGVAYHSLLDRLPENVVVTLIRDIHLQNGKVYFIGHEYVYSYDPKQNAITVISSDLQLYPSYKFGDQIIIMVDQKGLHQVSGDSLKLMPGGAYWADLSIDKIVDYDKNSFMTLSSKYGAHIYNKNKPYPSELLDDPYFKSNQLFGANKLNNGDYGLCFLTGGFVLTDGEMNPKLVLDKSAGINNQVHNVFQDQESNLWISTNDGLIYLNITSPINKISKPQGLEGNVNETVIYKGNQYVIGYAGTYYRGLPDQINILDPNERFFKKVDNSEIGGISILASEDWLFSAHTRKKGEIRDHQFIPLLENKNTYHAFAVFSKDDNVILTSKESGNEIEVFKSIKGSWKHDNSILDDRLPKDHIHTIAYDKLAKCYWAASLYGSVFKFKLNQSNDSIAEILMLDDSHGLPPDSQNKILALEDKIYIATSKGLMYFSDSDQKLKKDMRFGDYFDNTGVYSLAKENDSSYWYVTTSQEIGHLIMNPLTSDKSSEKSLFSTINPGSITHYFEILDDGHLAIGGLDGFYAIQTNKKETHSFNFDPIIRSASIIQEDSIIYRGSKDKTVDYVLDHDFNSLNFRYAAPFFKGVSKVLYKTKLDGFDEGWSEWNDKTEQDFTNIPFGKYTFSVQAKNVFGELSSVASFDFEIEPPSYLTWWAIMIYIVILVIIIMVIVRLNARRLIRKNVELEATIKERVKEIEKQKDIIAKSLIEKESLLKEIHHRVKNNLQIIASLLYLQSGKFENEDFKRVLEEGQGRVRSMALIHQKLYENDDLKSIPFDEYLTELVGEIRASFGMVQIQLNVEAKDIFFDVDTAVPLGLIVNELATNAFKYAFAKVPKGSFSISLTQEGNRYMLSVKDDGQGIPDEIDIKKTKSLGLRLVRMLSQQLEGDFVFESKDGTNFSLTFAA